MWSKETRLRDENGRSSHSSCAALTCADRRWLNANRTRGFPNTHHRESRNPSLDPAERERERESRGLTQALSRETLESNSQEKTLERRETSDAQNALRARSDSASRRVARASSVVLERSSSVVVDTRRRAARTISLSLRVICGKTRLRARKASPRASRCFFQSARYIAPRTHTFERRKYALPCGRQSVERLRTHHRRF